MKEEKKVISRQRNKQEKIMGNQLGNRRPIIVCKEQT